LNRRQEQADEHANDGDHRQKLDKRKTAAAESGSPIMNLT
jgi:hypothetical protein